MFKNETFLIIGASDLIGWQIISDIIKNLSPKKITIAALQKDEAEQTLAELRAAFSYHSVQWDAVWGNFFIRTDYAHLPCEDLFHDEEKRENMYQDLFGCLDAAYENSYLVKLIQEQQANVIIDNLDLGCWIFRKNNYVAAKNEFNALVEAIETNTVDFHQLANTRTIFDNLLLSNALPQVIRQAQLVFRAMVEAKARLYVKLESKSKQKQSGYLFQVAINSAYQGLMSSMRDSFDMPAMATLNSNEKLSEGISEFFTTKVVS